MKEFMSYEASLEILRLTLAPWDRVEKVTLTQALDRRIAVDIAAQDNYPARPVSAMDGYAFLWQEGLSELKLITDLPAGSDKGLKVEGVKCVKTFTGSLMSDGADTLIPVSSIAGGARHLKTYTNYIEY